MVIPIWVLPLLLSVIILGGIVIIAVDAVPNYLRVAPEGVNIFQSLIPGMADSYEKGKEHGLSAEDTELVLADRLKENGKTEVLIADGDITDFQKYSSELFNPELFTPLPGNRLNTGKTLIKMKNRLSPKR